MDIKPPDPDRPPLRTNLFDAVQKGNANLTMLFPYLHPGAIVPAGALFIGGPDYDYGHFIHHNTVDEVITSFSSVGSTLKSGQTYIGGRVHGVNSFLRNPADPESFAVMSIVQRQVEEGTQSEAISVLCPKCRNRLFQYDFDATPGKNATEADHPFPSVAILKKGIDRFNADVALRTCDKCEHVAEPFPIETWGWEEYSKRSRAAAMGRRNQPDGAR